jgi:cytochrome c biogenesis protein CcmG/thiol:disulfide interchange protein DsbE
MSPHRPLRLVVGALLSAAVLALAACAHSQNAGVAAQANHLVDGSPKDFRARLDGLRGRPVVVNQWASWCGPCRSEFPFFQHLAARYRGRVVFLGLDSRDSRSDAESFLKQLPVPYPNYYDEDASIARSLGIGRGWPTTVFFRASGKLEYIHIGAYATEDRLDADIKRYALGG